MSHDLEERLTQQLNEWSGTQPATNDLASVKQRARQRSWRSRAAVGILALVALAGIGSAVGTREEPNALVTATVPTPSVQTEDRPTPAPAATVATAVPEPSTQVGDGFVDPPRPLDLVPDGNGGFVAMTFTTGPGVVDFVRSNDGKNWFLDDSWTLPEGTRIDGFDYVDDLFIAQLDSVGDATGQYRLFLNPQLAVSQDLRTWFFVDVTIGRGDERAGESAGNTPADQYSIEAIARSGNDVAIVMLRVPQTDMSIYERASQLPCGEIRRPSGNVMFSCDGVVTELGTDNLGRYAPYDGQVLVSRDGAPATVTDIDVTGSVDINILRSVHALIPSEDEFQLIEPGANVETVLPRRLLDRLPEDATVVAAERRSTTEILLIIEAGDKLIPAVLSTGQAALGSFPQTIRATPSHEIFINTLGAGPAGWAMNLNILDGRIVDIEKNGWKVEGFSGSPSARLHSEARAETIHYDAAAGALPYGVEIGLFGEVRYLHPETGEVLVELAATEANTPPARVAGLFPTAFNQSVSQDGWTLAGNPLSGPLTLTSPEGDVREFADGFAFDNNDITDGVEAEIGFGAFDDFAIKKTGAIRFYDDAGNKTVEFNGLKIFNALAMTIIDEAGDLDLPVSEQPWNSPILFSPDGLQWEVLSIGDRIESTPVMHTVVGDDEVLVVSLPEIIRLPIDE